MFKLAVIGSRTFEDKQLLNRILDRNISKISMIVSGRATGADEFSEQWAIANCVPYLIFPAKWRDKDGNRDLGAGFRRNIQIIKNCDKVLAFWDGLSRGTNHSISLAKQYNKPVTIVHFSANAKEL